MKGWKLRLKLVSASNLLYVRSIGYQRVYAEVSINEIQELTYKSPVDWIGRTNPVWNFEAPYSITNEILRGGKDEFKLVVKLYCERTFLGDKYVGEVKIPLKKLFKSRNVNGDFGDFDVKRADETGGFGALKLSYSFAQTVFKQKSSQEDETCRVVSRVGQGYQIIRRLFRLAVRLIVMGLVDFFVPGASISFDLF